MHNSSRSFRSLLIALLILIVISYAFFQARKVITGPDIKFVSPQNGESFENALVEIQGKTKNIYSITLNDRPIFIDDIGLFREKLLLSPGYNIIEAEAKDRFGKTTRKTLELVYLAEENSAAQEPEASAPATSSPAQ